MTIHESNNQEKISKWTKLNLKLRKSNLKKKRKCTQRKLTKKAKLIYNPQTQPKGYNSKIKPSNYFFCFIFLSVIDAEV